MFDFAAEIVTDKKWGDISASEFIAAIRARLDRLEANPEGTEPFGKCDEFEVQG